jgi:hypothetical protein
MKRRGKGAAKVGVRGRMEGLKARSIHAIFQGVGFIRLIALIIYDGI